MNIFENDLLRRLLRRRAQLHAELMRFTNAGDDLHEYIVHRGIKARRSVQIERIRMQIMNVNKQIGEFLDKG